MPNRFNGAFPSSKIVKLKYNEYIPISSNTSGTVISQYRFNCNSLYDPNQSGTGHQPLYYDTYAGLYNHYLVLGSRIKVTWQGQTNGGIPIVVGVFLNVIVLANFVPELGNLSRDRWRVFEVSGSGGILELGELGDEFDFDVAAESSKVSAEIHALTE